MSNQYAKRDHLALGEHYLRHVSAMTGEGLHAKSDIAAELAWRDAEIERLRSALRNLLVMLPSELSAPDVVESAIIPVGFCYVRWVDIKEGYAALADTEAKP